MLVVAQRAANGLAVALFTALFAVFLIQIAARFIWNAPLPWTDELAVILYTWGVLWGCAACVSWREHVAFDSLTDALPQPFRRAALVVQALALGGLCAWALPACLDYVHFMARESTPVLGWRYHWVFMPFCILLLAIVLRSAAQIFQQLKRPPE
jgi:TRAP-type transport system small permease protein